MDAKLPLAITLALISCSAFADRTPPEARWQAWQLSQTLQQNSPAKALPWRSIGPADQGGRVVDIELDPNDPHTFYVAYASGGLWKTSNNGQSFTPLSDGLPSMVNGDLELGPKDSQVLWLGTGEPNASRSSYSGLGVYKSVDGGKSFVSKGLLGADRISKVLVDPNNSQRILVAVQGALYSAGGMRGVYVSDNGGETWQQVLKGDNAWTGASDLVFHPTDPSIVYAALWETERKAHDYREAGTGSGVYRSNDGGKTFSRLSFVKGNGVGRIGLGVSADKPDWIYASVDQQDTLPADMLYQGDSPLTPQRLKTMSKEQFLLLDAEQVELFLRGLDFPYSLDAASLIAQIKSDALTMDQLRARLLDGNSSLFSTEIRGLELYRSEDRGDTFSKTHTQPIRNVTYTYGYYFGKLAVAPDNAQQVTLLGVPIIVSDDGGKTFSGRLNQEDVHVDHHVWVIDPKNPNRIFNGNDGGVDVSYDRGAHFTRLDRGAHGQSYAVQFDMQTPYNVYTGMQDNGTYRGSSKSKPNDLSAWTFLSGGDGMQIQVDPRDNSVYTGYQFGNYRYSGGHEVRPKAPMDEPLYRFNWQTPIQLSKHNSDVLYMGGNKFFRSLDKGKTFEAISGDLTRSKARGDVPFATITTLAESDLQFGLLWAGTDDGQVWVSNDSGAQWRDVGKALPDGWVSTVEPSRQARFRAYVALNRYRLDEQTPLLFVTEDLGKSFRDISKGLPAMPINVVREDPINPDVLYVGTDRGVFASLDRGKNWISIGSGMPNVAVHDLRVHPRDRELIAGTHGRSVWILDVLPIQELGSVSKQGKLHAFYVDAFQYERSFRSAVRADDWFAHLQEAPAITLNFYAPRAGMVEIAVLDKDGETVQNLKVQANAGLNQYRWDAKVNAELALAAENKRIQKARETDPKKVINDSEQPYRQAQRYDWPFYVQAGEYRLQFVQAGERSEVKLTVNAAKPIPPRKSTPVSVRGK